MNFNDFTSGQQGNPTLTAFIDPEVIQGIPSVIKKEIDRIDCNDKLSDEILTAVVKKVQKVDPYNLDDFKYDADHITFCSYWHGGSTGTQFYWRGNIGNIFQTFEEIEGATNQGDVRIFFGLPFYASNVHVNHTHQKVGWFSKEYKYWRTEINWTIPNATEKWIAEFKHKLFR